MFRSLICTRFFRAHPLGGLRAFVVRSFSRRDRAYTTARVMYVRYTAKIGNWLRCSECNAQELYPTYCKQSAEYLSEVA